MNNLPTYDMLNNLIPGVVLSMLLSKYTSYQLLQSDFVAGIFLYYFVGVVVNRFGSLVIKPLIEKDKQTAEEYKRYITASQKDSKIDILSQTNNVYRSFISLIILFFIIKCFELMTQVAPFLNLIQIPLFLITLLIMFVVSYNKQSKYIQQRVDNAHGINALEDHNKEVL